MSDKEVVEKLRDEIEEKMQSVFPGVKVEVIKHDANEVEDES